MKPFKSGGLEIIVYTALIGSLFSLYAFLTQWQYIKLAKGEILPKVNIGLSGIFILVHLLVVLYVIYMFSTH